VLDAGWLVSPSPGRGGRLKVDESSVEPSPSSSEEETDDDGEKKGSSQKEESSDGSPDRRVEALRLVLPVRVLVLLGSLWRDPDKL
jgi:hypothetical protein